MSLPSYIVSVWQGIKLRYELFVPKIFHGDQGGKTLHII